MRIFLLVLFVVSLAGCTVRTGAVKVDTGEQLVGGRLSMELDGPWNFIKAPNSGPAQYWTMEGLPIDQLLIYSGVKDGKAIHPVSRGSKPVVFRSGMRPDEVISLFERMLTRDGSTFQLTKSEPAAFGGVKGFHFEFKLVRKIDSLELAGLGYGSVSDGELFSIIYMAPRMTFFGRHQTRVENMARGARIKEIQSGPKL